MDEWMKIYIYIKNAGDNERKTGPQKKRENVMKETK